MSDRETGFDEEFWTEIKQATDRVQKHVGIDRNAAFLGVMLEAVCAHLGDIELSVLEVSDDSEHENEPWKQPSDEEDES